MNNRLQQFLAAENISQSQFADSIGVAKASVSHILAGRNKPGFEFLEGMIKCYPDLNIDWLITGHGKMYKSQQEKNVIKQPSTVAARNDDDDLFAGLDETEKETSISDPEPAVVHSSPEIQNTPKLTASLLSDNSPRIEKILIFYDNGTYKEIK